MMEFKEAHTQFGVRRLACQRLRTIGWLGCVSEVARSCATNEGRYGCAHHRREVICDLGPQDGDEFSVSQSLPLQHPKS